MHNLPDSTYGMYERFKCGMRDKQERVCFATKQVVLFTEAVPVSTPYCLPSLLATANQISQFGEVPHGCC
mgnify:CR=1 FL=1